MEKKTQFKFLNAQLASSISYKNLWVWFDSSAGAILNVIPLCYRSPTFKPFAEPAPNLRRPASHSLLAAREASSSPLFGVGSYSGRHYPPTPNFIVRDTILRYCTLPPKFILRYESGAIGWRTVLSGHYYPRTRPAILAWLGISNGFVTPGPSMVRTLWEEEKNCSRQKANSLVNGYCAAPRFVQSLRPNQGRISDILEKLALHLQ